MTLSEMISRLKEIEFNIDLIKSRRGIIAIAAGSLVITGAHLIGYAPLQKKIGVQHERAQQLEREASIARQEASANWGDQPRLILARENAISSVINEITMNGKKARINFISIVPGSVTRIDGISLRVIPVKFETESGYRSLAAFLDGVRRIKSGFATVRQIDLKGDPGRPSQVNAQLMIFIYLAN